MVFTLANTSTLVLVKFMFPKKATKNYEIFTVDFDVYLGSVKSTLGAIH